MLSRLCIYWTTSTITNPSLRVIVWSSVFPVAPHRNFLQYKKSINSLKSIRSGRQFSSSRQTPGLLCSRSRLQFRLIQNLYRGTSKLSSASKTENLGIGARLKGLSREYGWSAFGVYLALSALDFPFCYLLVKYLGADKIGEWEQVAILNLKRLIPEDIKKLYNQWRSSENNSVETESNLEQQANNSLESHQRVEPILIGTKETEDENKKNASLATQLALAYAVHKSFIFLRVPITAALTPRIVKMLRGWGWNIGKKIARKEISLKGAALGTKSHTPGASGRNLVQPWKPSSPGKTVKK